MGAYDLYQSSELDRDDRPAKSENLYKGDPGQVCPRFDKAFCSGNLYLAFKTLKYRSPSQGPLATTISEAEGGNLARELAKRIEYGVYKPGTPSKVTLKKPGGGQRELQVPPIPDRMVGLAMHAALCPFGEKIFSSRSFGFRPRIVRLEMLTSLISSIEQGERWYVMTDDVKSAFDNITIEHVMAAHHQLLPAETRPVAQWLDMIERCLRGSTAKNLGIGQGYPYSPLAWNVTMHFYHDKFVLPLPWFRYADNFARCCQPGKQEQSRVSSRELLTAVGLELHKEAQANLLDGESIEVLGYRLNHDNDHVRLDITDQFWDNVKRSLMEIHEGPRYDASSVLRGYINLLTPLHPVDAQHHFTKLLETYSQYAFPLDNRELLWEGYTAANTEWRLMRQVR